MPNPVPRKNQRDLRGTAVEPDDLSILCIPLELPDQAAADLLEFLQNLT